MIITPSAKGLLNSNVFFCWEDKTWPQVIFFIQTDSTGLFYCAWKYIYLKWAWLGFRYMFALQWELCPCSSRSMGQHQEGIGDRSLLVLNGWHWGWGFCSISRDAHSGPWEVCGIFLCQVSCGWEAPIWKPTWATEGPCQKCGNV